MTTVALTRNQPVINNGVERGVAVVKLTHADLTTAGLSQAITFADLAVAHPVGASQVPANAIITRFWLRRITDFAGGTVATLVLDVGDTADADEIASGLDIFTGAKATAAVSQGDESYAAFAAAGITPWVQALGRVAIVASTADVLRYVHRGPPVVITSIDTVTNKALATGNATLTASINSTAVTTGVVTIAEAASAAGDIDTAAPTAARTMVAGDVLKIVVTGTNDAAGSVADVTISGHVLGAFEATAYAPKVTVTSTVGNVVALTAGECELVLEYIACSTVAQVG
jgi:hypothetical protein